ncbi:MAG TPA: MASE4 domain-containing protein [Pyrinomonadaceae bacterium]
MPASAQQRWIAAGIVAVFAIVFALLIPFAARQVGRIDAFLPVVQSIICIADLITAVLLFAQYSIRPQRALLALASGYMCSGSFAFLQTLTFPGAYATAALMGDGPNTPAWLYVFWHTAFPAAILVYALTKDRSKAARPDRPATSAVALTVTCVVLLIAALTWIATTKAEYLPKFYISDIRLQTQLGNQINVALSLWNATALAVLLYRRRTMLDLWLTVILLAYMPNFLVAIIGSSVRFTVGWYAARGFVLVGSCMLLTVLLVETLLLYSRLASAITLQRRERTHRLLSVDEATSAIAHEINQPLAAITLNCEAMLLALERAPPDAGELKETVQDTLADGRRAGDIVAAVRALFKSAVTQRTKVDVNRLVRQVLRMVENDLQVHGVAVSTEFEQDVQHTIADPTQLQQVVLNLVKNAIEAMAAGPATKRALRLVTTKTGQSTPSLVVQDLGPGINVKDERRVFDPFFTTKSSGMGLGLSISRRIIESHGGDLRLIETSSSGSTFEITLPGAA